jgi:nicotinamide phosphoribosyltransferase
MKAISPAKGLIQVYRDESTGRLLLKDECTWEEVAQGELKTVFKDGQLMVYRTLSEIRTKLKEQLGVSTVLQ